MPAYVLSLLCAAFAAAAPAKFDDAALQSRLTQSRETNSNLLVYFWSPQMPLSVKGLADLLRDEKRSYRVLVLLDDGANLREARRVVKERGWGEAALVRNESAKLRKLGARVHYPAYLFVKRGTYAAELLPGYRDPQELAELTKGYF